MINTATIHMIRPRAELIARAGEEHVDRNLMFLRPSLYFKHAPSNEGLSSADIDAQVKLLFLAEVCWAFLDPEESSLPVIDFLTSIIGSGSLGIRHFDAHWTLESYEAIESFIDDIEEQIDRSSVARLESTGRERVDKWLKQLVCSKRHEAT